MTLPLSLYGFGEEWNRSLRLDIFVPVNSGGRKLDASDLMFAAMNEGWREIEQFKDVEDGIELNLM
jgi:hypothetical protein